MDGIRDHHVKQNNWDPQTQVLPVFSHMLNSDHHNKKNHESKMGNVGKVKGKKEN
jgi:hypothetical protein